VCVCVQDPDYFDKLSSSQSPSILYIGCSDSRVTEAEIMGVGPGDAFVHRNIANMVCNGDLGVVRQLWCRCSVV
jgi:carbonic anhydrase